MAFGQQSGPPATHGQVQELMALLQEAGHSDFRDARGPMGFTQRQAGGKFTRDEADAFIESLRDHDDAPGPNEQAVAEPVAPAPTPERAPARVAPRTSSVDQVLRRIPAAQLAAELQRRGWVVMEP